MAHCDGGSCHRFGPVLGMVGPNSNSGVPIIASHWGLGVSPRPMKGGWLLELNDLESWTELLQRFVDEPALRRDGQPDRTMASTAACATGICELYQ